MEGSLLNATYALKSLVLVRAAGGNWFVPIGLVLDEGP